ncbi:Hypothetical protein SRAE_2000186000 [Strongyloides ratti]|uniref:Uncharacterized protein n=1 Tax=Strongyloides ratti TaxID=34506 RepID=A0A090LIA4_STRRB|nr:Hypothetical protein SRAE_2000186000 [Strongyloides ratti]CEF67195.1 Hypothetical protein SRAE_2000186000 [Strongyloides ratti]
MLLSQVLFSYLKKNTIKLGKLVNGRKNQAIARNFKERADEFMKSPMGMRFKMIILTGTITIYPIGAFIVNGPLIKYTFPWRFNVSYELPEKLKKLIDEEYSNFLEKQSRKKNDAVVRFSINNDESVHDSTSKSSLSIRFGAEISLPFYCQFESIEEATEYYWDSKLGQEIVETMYLTDRAKKFLITRDMFANDGYQAFANRPIIWTVWTMVSSFFVFAIHNKSKICNKSAVSFAILYSIMLGFSSFGSAQWHQFYRCVQDLRGDDEVLHMNSSYCDGAKEYYIKMLRRNRLFRTIMKDGLNKITAVGDIRGTSTSIVARYNLLLTKH